MNEPFAWICSCSWPVRALMAATTLGTALLAAPVRAEFAIAISPPRFEFEAKPGQVVRRTFDVTSSASRAAKLSVKTADWSYRQDGSVIFSDELAPDSCRPWVAIERRELTASPGKPYRFRFEVAPPAGTAPVECRFAILLEGEDEHTGAGGVQVPFNARLAVIVYVGVGDVQPRLSVVGSGVDALNEQPTPVLHIRNDGAAHGRLDGFLSGVDSTNAKFDFVPSNAPILPGETRHVPLLATRRGDPDTPVNVQFPVTIKGKLEWGKNESQEIEQRFDR